MENKDFVTTTELAKILGMSRMGVFKQIRSGKIKAGKVGRAYPIARKDLPVILGTVIGKRGEETINRAIDKAVKQYGETFRLLGQE